jgi:hypothetical protein
MLFGSTENIFHGLDMYGHSSMKRRRSVFWELSTDPVDTPYSVSDQRAVTTSSDLGPIQGVRCLRMDPPAVPQPTVPHELTVPSATWDLPDLDKLSEGLRAQHVWRPAPIRQLLTLETCCVRLKGRLCVSARCKPHVDSRCMCPKVETFVGWWN